MAIYTYVGNKASDNHTSRILFSTGKDMVIGEQVDLTPQEIIEVGRATTLNIVAGTVAVTINKNNFPPVTYYSRPGGTLTVTRW